MCRSINYHNTLINNFPFQHKLLTITLTLSKGIKKQYGNSFQAIQTTLFTLWDTLELISLKTKRNIIIVARHFRHECKWF